MKARSKMDKHTQLMERVYVQLVKETLLNEVMASNPNNNMKALEDSLENGSDFIFNVQNGVNDLLTKGDIVPPQEMQVLNQIKKNSLILAKAITQLSEAVETFTNEKDHPNKYQQLITVISGLPDVYTTYSTMFQSWSNLSIRDNTGLKNITSSIDDAFKNLRKSAEAIFHAKKNLVPELQKQMTAGGQAERRAAQSQPANIFNRN